MHIEQHQKWLGTGVLLDIQGHSEAALAGDLARMATPAVSDIAGLPVESTVTLVRPDGTPCTAGHPEGPGVELSGWDQRTEQGPTARALRGRLSIILNDRSPDNRWPEHFGNLTAAGYRSAVAIPLPVEGGYRAALTLYSAEANIFAPDVAAKVMVFSGVAAKSLRLALQYRADLAVSAEHRATLASRTAIDIACGVIMGRKRCSLEEALEILAQVSAQKKLQLRDVAESILKVMPGGIPATHFDSGR